MELEHYLGIGCIAIVIGFVIYKRLTRGETLKDIYKKIDEGDGQPTDNSDNGEHRPSD